MNPTLDLTGLGRMQERLRKLGDPDATTLMVSWMKTVDDGNRRGVLAGIDARGVAMAPVKYRPVGAPLRPDRKRGGFGGFGPGARGLHNNLTSAEYKRLTGPPLAPRGLGSRVITNFMTDYAKLRVGYWQTTSWWQDVVSTRGVSFLRFHFDGAAHLPRRDLRGIRPDDVKKCAASARAWMIDAIRAGGV